MLTSMFHVDMKWILCSRYAPDKACNIIAACIVLHNLARHLPVPVHHCSPQCVNDDHDDTGQGEWIQILRDSSGREADFYCQHWFYAQEVSINKIVQKLRNLDFRASIIQTFYRCVIKSLTKFSFMCWFGSLTVKNRNVLRRVVNVCSKVVGERQAN